MYWKISKKIISILTLLVFKFTIVIACEVSKKGSSNSQCDTTKSWIIDELTTKIAKATDIKKLDILCDIERYDTSRILGDNEIIYLQNTYNCPCKTVYLRNRKETLFCLDYFLDFPERIKVYNEFISNSGIKINNQDMAEEYVKTLVSLSKLYSIKSLLKDDDGKESSTNDNFFVVSVIVVRNVAIDPTNFEQYDQELNLKIKVEISGKLAIIKIQ